MNKPLTFILALITQLSIAQQWQYYSPTFGYDINAVSITGPGVIAIGGGQETNDSLQIMFHSDDYGQTWVENEHDGYFPWNKSIAFSDPVNGFGVGNDGRIIQSNDGGLHWGYAVTPYNRDWNKIVNVNAQTYYIAGGNRSSDSIQTILKTSDGGANWTMVYDQPGPWLKSIFFTDTLHGIAVGDSGVILKTANGGGLWTPVASPVQRDFNGITFINSNTGFIAGGNANHRTILRTDNGGTGWAVVIDTTGGILNDITFANDTTGYAVGDNATVLKTTDGGLNWLPETISNTLTGNEEIRTVDFYDENFGVIGGEQGLLYVYLGNPLSYTIFHTEEESSVTYTSATLNATVRGLTVPMNLFFEYDTTPVFTQSLQATPSFINDTLLHTVTAALSLLQPFTTYFYRLKGVSGAVIYYGNTRYLYTSPLLGDDSFVSGAATNVTDTSATLNGIVSGFYSATPVMVSFQYGVTEAFGNEVTVGAVSINDTLQHSALAPITGLSPDTVVYYYRLKVINGADVYFGNTRKLHTGLSEIPNWDFKNWQTETTLLPSRWYVSSEYFSRVAGYSGNYALQLTGPTLLFLGQPTKPVIVCGAAFNSRPDSVSVYLKYSIESGDTGYLGIYMAKNGQEVAPFEAYPITGNSGGVFKRMSYPISYNSPLIPDSITMFFTSSSPFFRETNPFHTPDTVFMLSTIAIDDISFSPSNSNVPNNSFESWFNYTFEKPEGWETESYIIDEASIPAVPMVSKSFLSVPNEYALQLQNIEVGGYLRRGLTATCENFFKNTPDFPISYKYQTLSGYFQFMPENGDSMFVKVSFKNGGRYGKVIASGEYVFNQPVDTFTPFEIFMSYYTDYNVFDTLIPDWANITFNPTDLIPNGRTKLIIDKLRFDGFAAMDSIVVTDNEEYVNATFEGTTLKVYPNPTHNAVTIELTEPATNESLVQLYSLNGQLLKQIKIQANETRTSFSMAELESGFYFLRMKSGGQVYNKKISVIK